MVDFGVTFLRLCNHLDTDSGPSAISSSPRVEVEFPFNS